MNFSKLQKLTFYTFLEQNGLESLYLAQLLKQLRQNTPIPERKYIGSLVSRVDNPIDTTELKKAAILFCLHTEKPKDGFIDMLIKELIKETEIEFSEKQIVEHNTKLNLLLNKLNLPELPLSTNLALRASIYSPLFKQQYRYLLET